MADEFAKFAQPISKKARSTGAASSASSASPTPSLEFAKFAQTPDYTANPAGEGTYKMHAGDKGAVVSVPHSKVAQAIVAGYDFVDSSQEELFDKNATPGWRASIDEFLANPTESSPDTGWKGDLERFGAGGAQGVTAPFLHPEQTANALLDQTAAILAPLSPRGERGREEMLQSYEAAKQDPWRAAGQFIVPIAVTEGAMRGAGAFARSLREGAPRVAQHITGANQAAIEAVQDAVEQSRANEAAYQTSVDERAAKIKADEKNHFKRMEAQREHIDDVHRQAVEENAQENATKKAERDAKIARIQQENAEAEAHAEEATRKRVEQSKAEYAQNVKDAEELEGRRGILTRRKLALQDRLARRVKSIEARARGRLNNQFDVVRKAVGNREAPVDSLVKATEAAKASLQGVHDAVPEFEGILEQVQTESALDDYRDQISRESFGEDYGTLKDPEKRAIDGYIEKVPPPGATSETVTYNYLRRLSSRLGNKIPTTADGMVRNALRAVKQRADAMAQHMADEAGVGAKHRSAIHDYRIYKEVFHEPTGPSGSGSAVAKSFLAEDAANATKPFLDDDPHVASRARRLLVGRPSEGPYYDAQAGQLLDRLRATHKELGDLPKPKEVAPYEEPEPVKPTGKQKVPEPYKEKPAPEPPTETDKFGAMPWRPPLPEEIPPPTPVEVNVAETMLSKFRSTARSWKRLTPGDITWILSSTIAVPLLKAFGGRGESGLATMLGVTRALRPIVGRTLESDSVLRWAQHPDPRTIDIISRIPGVDRIKFTDEITRELVEKARRGTPVKISPEVQRMLGERNVREIAKGIAAGALGTVSAQPPKPASEESSSKLEPGKKAKIGDTVHLQGFTGTVVSIHPRTGKLIVHWQTQPQAAP